MLSSTNSFYFPIIYSSIFVTVMQIWPVGMRLRHRLVYVVMALAERCRMIGMIMQIMTIIVAVQMFVMTIAIIMVVLVLFTKEYQHGIN